VLGETFVIRHKGVDDFDRRRLLLWLRDLHRLDRPAQWPFVCQVWLAAWFGTLQELISRWADYRAAGDWHRRRCRRSGPLLPLEMQQTIMQLWARQLWWSVEDVTAHLAAQRLDGCPSRVEQIGRASGLRLARRLLRERFPLGPELLRRKDEWLVQRLFALLDQWHSHLALGQRLAPSELLDGAEVLALRDELALGSGRARDKALPWGERLQHLLCGDWERGEAGRVECPHCGREPLRRKSGKPRAKR
jgi:hypothetical protein